MDAAALAEWPGAPFPASLVTAAGEQVRDRCGWHIAPVETGTVTVHSDGSATLLLPSLKVVDVTAVRDVTRDDTTVLDGWRLAPSGILYRASRWPVGLIEVDLSHGYAACPESLYAVVAERAQFMRRDRSVGQESLGSRSISIRSERSSGSEGPSPAEQVLARYTVTPGP